MNYYKLNKYFNFAWQDNYFFINLPNHYISFLWQKGHFEINWSNKSNEK